MLTSITLYFRREEKPEQQNISSFFIEQYALKFFTFEDITNKRNPHRQIPNPPYLC